MKRTNHLKIPLLVIESVRFFTFFFIIILFCFTTTCKARNPFDELIKIEKSSKRGRLWASNTFKYKTKSQRKSQYFKQIKERKVILKTSDGLERYGILTLVPNAKGNVVICHPAAKNKEYMIPYQEKLFAQYNCLRFDFRRHGENHENQYSTLGRDEVHEVTTAVKLFREHKKTRLLPTYGFGISMGAVTLILAESQKHMLDGIIVQSPFEKLRNQITRMYGFFRLPLMHNFIYRMPAKFISKKMYRLKMRKIRPYIAIRTIKTPIFFIHAQNDRFVPFESYKTFIKNDWNGCIKKTWTPEDGRHTAIIKIMPKLYAKKCSEFLETIDPRKKNKPRKTLRAYNNFFKKYFSFI
jgi:predicted alpha/beta-fold hydrolase